MPDSPQVPATSIGPLALVEYPHPALLRPAKPLVRIDEAVCDAVLERVPVGDAVDDVVGVVVIDADPVALGVNDPLWLMDAVPEGVAALLGV